MILLAGGPAPCSEHGSGLYYSCALGPSVSARWAWVADTHVSGDAGATQLGFEQARQSERAVAEIRQWQPCGALVNGDLAWSEGLAEDYERFGDIMRPLAAEAALVLAPGNHDSRGSLLERLGGRQGAAPQWLAAVVEQSPYRLVTLDSSIDTATIGGRIGSEQLDWLDELLTAQPPAKTIVFVHHPGESSSAGCRDFDDLVSLAQRQPSIQAIVTAHDHAYRLARAGPVHHICLPAVGFSFEHDIPTGWIEATLGEAGIDLRMSGAGHAATTRLPWR